MTAKLYLVMTTVENQSQAEHLARLLVEQKLAACVSIGDGVTSLFPWKGQVDTARELPLTIKTLPERIDDIKQVFVDHHPYDVPEMLVLPVIDGLTPYFEWARDWIK
jgi:periplasmic divalent cation tolerance protein